MLNCFKILSKIKLLQSLLNVFLRVMLIQFETFIFGGSMTSISVKSKFISSFVLPSSIAGFKFDFVMFCAEYLIKK